MPSYISELINDKTIIGACIGATFSLIGALVAYLLNLRLERIKLIKDKKESLFNYNQSLLIIIAEINSYDRRFSSDISSLAKSLENKKNEAKSNIKLMTNLYFNRLDKEFSTALLEIDSIFEYVKLNKNPGIEAFSSAIGKLTNLSDKILKI